MSGRTGGTDRAFSHRRAHRNLQFRRVRARDAFAEERRIVVGDEGGGVRHQRECASLVASFAADVPVRESGARTDRAFSHRRGPRCFRLCYTRVVRRDERRVVAGDQEV